MASIANFKIPAVSNEPNQYFAKGTESRTKLESAVEALTKKIPLEVPLVISGQEIKGSSVLSQRNPSSHADVVCNYSNADKEHVEAAIESALAARSSWESMPFSDRAAIFLKAAHLIATKYRYEVMAATMLGQGKNAWQAEIDAAAELVDFLRFNVQYAEEMYSQQPVHHAPGIWNRLEYRALEGFVYAISPFNFTAIGGNLPAAPALMGNVVVWKPSPSAIASNWLVYSILREAGLPANVIQFVPGDAEAVTASVLAHKEFAALHYTGSTAVFRSLYGRIGQGVAEGRYRSYPRIVGETGGKNFHLVHRSADIRNAVVNTVRGAFEFQGQKCSATSRLYVAKSIWPEFKKQLVAETEALKVGPPQDFANFCGPVIHEAAFKRLSGAIDAAKSDSELTLLVGGKHDSSTGYFVHPTVYESTNPDHALFNTELFGPILVAYAYDDTSSDPELAFADACALVDRSGGGYALTGAVFAGDRTAARRAEDALRHAAGNFYVNCKSTGAVVGQQPFGGARASGTNSKAGSASLLSQFVSVRAVKEQMFADEGVPYPSNEV